MLHMGGALVIGLQKSFVAWSVLALVGLSAVCIV